MVSKIKNHWRERKIQQCIDRCYQSIEDIPVKRWALVIDENDLKHLFIERVKTTNELQDEGLKRVWRTLNEQYITKFGFSEQFLAIIRKQKEISALLTDKIVNDNKSQNTFIKIAELELDKMRELAKGDGGGFLSGRSYIEKSLGFQFVGIDNETMSLSTYMRYVEEVTTMFKKQAA